MTHKILKILLLLMLVLAHVLGAGAQTVADDIWHDVQPGETLSTIARQYYGPDASWRSVAAQNPELPNPQSLVPGMRLRIDPGFTLPPPAPTPAQTTTTKPATTKPPASQATVKPSKPDTGKPQAKPAAPAKPVATPAASTAIPPEPDVTAATTTDPIEVVIDEISNEVDKNTGDGWEDAIVRERLGIDDGLRTLSASSSRLLVDGSRVNLTEFTQFVLREAEPVDGVVQDRRFDLERGEFVVDVPDAATSTVRIGVGDHRVAPVNQAGRTHFRVRKTKLGGVKVMVYEGRVRATGNQGSVEIDGGFGTTIEAGDEPSAPSVLLQPPVLVSPQSGATLPPSNIEFKWQFRDGALNYRLEICEDPECNQLVRRKLDHAETRWLTGSLGVGDYFWRVVAINPDELDGFAGESAPFKVREAQGAPSAPFFLPALIGGILLLAIILIAFLWPRPKRSRR